MTDLDRTEIVMPPLVVEGRVPPSRDRRRDRRRARQLGNRDALADGAPAEEDAAPDFDAADFDVAGDAIAVDVPGAATPAPAPVTVGTAPVTPVAPQDPTRPDSQAPPRPAAVSNREGRVEDGTIAVLDEAGDVVVEPKETGALTEHPELAAVARAPAPTARAERTPEAPPTPGTITTADELQAGVRARLDRLPATNLMADSSRETIARVTRSAEIATAQQRALGGGGGSAPPPRLPDPLEIDPIPKATAKIQQARNARLEPLELPEPIDMPDGTHVKLAKPKGVRTGELDVVVDAEKGTSPTATAGQAAQQVKAKQVSQQGARRDAISKSKQEPPPPTVAPVEIDPPVLIDVREPERPTFPAPAAQAAADHANVARALARLLADTKGEATAMVDTCRSMAFPGNRLGNSFKKEASDAEIPPLTDALDTEMRKLGEIAGVSVEEISSAIDARQKELAAVRDGQQVARSAYVKAATEELTTEAKRKLAKEAQARARDEARRIRRLQSAMWSSNPEIVNELVELRLTVIDADIGKGVLAHEAGATRRLELLDLYAIAYETAYRQASDAWQMAKPAERRWAPATKDGKVWLDVVRDDLNQGIKRLKADVETEKLSLLNALQDAGLEARAALREWAAKRTHTKLTEDQRTAAALSEKKRQDDGIAKARADAADSAIRSRLMSEVNFAIAAYDDQNKATNAGAAKDAIQLTDEQRAAGKEFLARGGDPADPMAAVAAQIRADFTTPQRLDPIVSSIRNKVLAMRPTDKEGLVELATVVFPGGSEKMKERADKLKDAFDGPGTDEQAVYDNLSGLDTQQAAMLTHWYYLEKDESLEWRIGDEMSGDEEDKAKALQRGDKVSAAQASIKLADGWFSDDPQAAVDAMAALTPEEAKQLLDRPGAKNALDKVTHGKRWSVIGGTVVDDNRASTQIELQMQLNAAKSKPGEPVTPEARKLQDEVNAFAMDRAIRDKHGKGDLNAMKQVYDQVRAQVSADPRTAALSADEFDNEVRTRMRGMEQAYEQRFGKDLPKGGVSALETAISWTWEGGAKADQARAFVHVDRAGQTAAGIQKTTYGLYTSDSEANAALQANFDKAKAEVERSTTQQQKINDETKVELAKREKAAGRPLSAWEREAYRNAITERVTQQLATEWFKDVKTTFGEKYADRWGGDKDTALYNMLVSETQFSGEREALTRYNNGGYLTDAQKVRFGVEGYGMDNEMVLGGIKGRTKEQLEEIASDYKKQYDEDMWDRLKDEAGGGPVDNRKETNRERFDIDEAKRGVPTNEQEALDAARRRYEYERDTYRITAEGRETMKTEYELATRRLRELDAARKSGNATAIRNAEQVFYRQAEASQAASQAYREAIDAKADKWVQAIAMAAAVVAALAATAISGGTLGPVALAAISSIAGTTATIASKSYMLGDAYGKNQLTDDILVGAVDLAVSMATARVGDMLLKLPKASGATKEALKASMKRIAAERAAKPVIARIGAQLAEQVAGAVPTSVFASLINRQTWKGDPIANVIDGAATAVVASVVVGGAVSHVTDQALLIAAAAKKSFQFHFGSGADIHPDTVILRSTREAAESGHLHPDPLTSRGTLEERTRAWKEYKSQFPEATMQEFNRALENGHQRLQAELEQAQRTFRDMRREMLASVSAEHRAALADTPIVILPDAEFTARTGSRSKGQAATLVIDGKPVIVVREGAPVAVLREEGIHVQQLRDPAHADKLPLLDEERLANWGSLSPEERMASWKAKLDLEIDAQQRLMTDLQAEMHATADPVVKEDLRSRLEEARAAHEVMSARKTEIGELDADALNEIRSGRRKPPEFSNEEPRLFNKKKPPPPPPTTPSAPTQGDLIADAARKKLEAEVNPKLDDARARLKSEQDDQDVLHDLDRRAEEALKRRAEAWQHQSRETDPAERARFRQQQVEAMAELREVLGEFQEKVGAGDIEAGTATGPELMEVRKELLTHRQESDKAIGHINETIDDLLHRLRPGEADERLPLGGSYGEVPTQKGEVNHIPPDSVTSLKYNHGPAIRMDKVDHRNVTTTGSSHEAVKWRQEQAQLLAQGRFLDAVKMDIDEIRTKYPGKYEKGIQQMLDYIAQNPEIAKMSKNSTVTIAQLRQP